MESINRPFSPIWEIHTPPSSRHGLADSCNFIIYEDEADWFEYLRKPDREQYYYDDDDSDTEMADVLAGENSDREYLELLVELAVADALADPNVHEVESEDEEEEEEEEEEDVEEEEEEITHTRPSLRDASHRVIAQPLIELGRQWLSESEYIVAEDVAAAEGNEFVTPRGLWGVLTPLPYYAGIPAEDGERRNKRRRIHSPGPGGIYDTWRPIQREDRRYWDDVEEHHTEFLTDYLNREPISEAPGTSATVTKTESLVTFDDGFSFANAFEVAVI